MLGTRTCNIQSIVSTGYQVPYGGIFRHSKTTKNIHNVSGNHMVPRLSDVTHGVYLEITSTVDW